MSTPAPLSRIVLATRESALAMWQARYIQARLQELHPGLDVQILGMTTEGDRKLDTSLAKIGGKGLFVKELEDCLLKGAADIAVHSMKDVPMDLLQGHVIAAIPRRADPRDAFVSNRYSSLAELPAGARGTRGTASAWSSALPAYGAKASCAVVGRISSSSPCVATFRHG